MMHSDEIEKLLHKVHCSEIVSFDIFDTLLLRNVCEPKDIFKIVEDEYNLKYNNNIDFSYIRIQCEKEAREKSELEDIDIDTIYECIEKRLDSNQCIILKDLEVRIEKKFIKGNHHIKPVYDYAINNNKIVFLISDMYLKKNTIENILNDNGFNGYNDIFISGEVNRSKASGSMYSYIRNNMNIDKGKKWVHVGDNYISDVKNACDNNICGVYYKRLMDRENDVKINNLSDSIIHASLINYKYSVENISFWENFGIMNVCPLYIGLMLKLKEWISDKDNIYFLARDGYIPFKLYEKLKIKYSYLPEGKYLYASRRSYIYPMMADKKEEAIKYFTVSDYARGQKLTIGDILKNLDIDYNDNLKDSYTDFNLDEVINVNNVDEINNKLSYLWDKINLNLKKEREILYRYFKQENIYNHNEINIFDIGWAGSTQRAIRELVRKEVKGFYFGTTESADKYVKKNSYGYAFNSGKPLKINKEVMKNVMMYELIFTSPEGTVKNFTDSDGIIIPVLKETQNSFSYKCVQKFQEYAQNAFDVVLEYMDYIDEPSKAYTLYSMSRLINEKKASDLYEFSKINNIVSIGESTDFKKYVNVVNAEEYIKNTRKYIEESSENLWPDSILIVDEQNRMFNEKEFNKLYSINNFNINIVKMKKMLTLFNKAIKNPKKAINKGMAIIGRLKNSY